MTCVMYCLQIQLMDQIHVSVMVHCIGNFLEVHIICLIQQNDFFPPFLLIVSKNIYILSENNLCAVEMHLFKLTLDFCSVQFVRDI